MNKFSAIVLAAGKGTRMRTKTPKVLLSIEKKPILVWTLELLKALQLESIIVLCHESDRIKSTLNKYHFHPETVTESNLNGTAQSVAVALPKVKTPYVLILYGDDSALYNPKTMTMFMREHIKSGADGTILTTKITKPASIGCLSKDNNGDVVSVWTKADMHSSGLHEFEAACGAFCFSTNWLRDALGKVAPSKSSGEYPLPGVIAVAVAENAHIRTHPISDSREWNTVNTPYELKKTRLKKRSLLNE